MRAEPGLARRVVRSVAAAGRVRAGCASGVRCGGDRARPRLDGAADCLRVAGRHRPCPEDCIATDVVKCRWLRPIRSVEAPEENSIPCWASIDRKPALVQAKATRQARGRGRERGLLEMSYCRAHQGSVLRLVLVLRDPWAPDTDRHHRRIREIVVDCRADGCAGRDEKDVGVRSCSCGVAVWLRRKVLLE